MKIATGEREKRVAERRIQGFAKQFGEAHLNLARHAAFPLALTPDLLYQIWANFVPEAPWIAVAHVLLSRLCRQVGYEIYEMDIADRNLLLRELKEQFGQEQFDKLGEFLLDYVAQRLIADDPDIQDLAEAQEWTALAYTKPNEAATQLAAALNDRVKEQNMTELFRLASLIESFAEPLKESGFEPLLIYSRGISHLVRGDMEEAKAHFREVPNKENQLEVATLRLLIPEQISKEVDEALKPDHPFSKLSDIRRFFAACNLSRLIDMGNPADRPYYINFATVYGRDIIETMYRRISLLSNEPTCQLFTGYIGSGKSTELLRLQAILEQEGFYVIYVASSQDIDMSDVDISDILLVIACQVSENLEAIQIKLQPKYFQNQFQEIANTWQTSIDFSNWSSFAATTRQITEHTKKSLKLRAQLRQYLEPRTSGILQSLNEELLKPATQQLKQQGYEGLVVIVDNLDRLDNRPLSGGRSLPEYLFVDRGDQLRQLNCHVIYTIPLSLILSQESEILNMHFGIAPKRLLMVPVKRRDGTDYEPGIALLRQMVLARAFPDLDAQQRLNHITALFDSPDTLDRLCCVSGGHLRNLLRFLYNCLLEADPPWSRDLLEGVIQELRDDLLSAIEDQTWELLFQVMQSKQLSGEQEYQTLLNALWLFEYRDEQGSWFDINPVLAESEQLKSGQKEKSVK